MKAVSTSPGQAFTRLLRALLTVTLALAALAGAWYAEENYRGGRAWEKARHDLEARGESLDAAHFIPPPVPDDQNLAMAPLFVRLYRYRVDPATGLLTFSKDADGAEYKTVVAMPFGSSADGPPRPLARGEWAAAQPLDLVSYQRYYRSRKDFPRSFSPQPAAEDILLALTRYRDALDEVAAAAATRPLARFPVNWTQRPAWNISLVHGSLIQDLTSALRLRACATLTLGRTDDALRDILLGWRLNDAMDQEPVLIADLVALTGRGLLLQPIWEGLASRRWTAVQLCELQAQLSAVDMLRSFRLAEQFERASFLVSIREELRRPEGFRELLAALQGVPTRDAGSGGWPGAIIRFSPHGWIDGAVAFACEWEQKYTIDAIDVPAHRLSPESFAAGIAALSGSRFSLTNMLIKVSAPVYESVARKNAREQVGVDEALTACALERFYLDHQAYPSSLQALVPTYLPRVPTDVIDGAPLRYQATLDGRYRLWEVGWNGRDDGGAVAWNKEGSRLDDKQGDWVWQYGPLAPGGKQPP